MATQQGSRLQHMLQSAVQSVQWTYSLFWQHCPQQGALVWGDGYYNGAIKTRKTIQPMEVSTEEASLQRSQQLRELYESLAAEETNQPARRPCAALSPEDLTESEWFYLMSVSFSFPTGIGLPGKALARQHHVWLTGANEADSKVFSRAILAKSAGVQTVVCIPVMDGVIELGTTDRIAEDLGLIQHVKSFFIDHQHYPNPAHSEHSTSNPITTPEHHRFHASPLLPMYSAMHPSSNANQDYEEEDDEEDDEEDGDSDSEAETDRNIHQSSARGPLRLCGPVSKDITMAQAAVEPSELMQLDMSEDIRLGSPDDGSNNLDSDMNMLGITQSVNLRHRPETSHRWSVLDEQFYRGLQPPVSEVPGIEEYTPEDTHYSETVSTILQKNSGPWSELPGSLTESRAIHSSFSKWDHQNVHVPAPILSQRILKYILFNVPFLYRKYGDETCPKAREVDTIKKCTSQDELNASHVLAERRRREKLNERFIILRSLVPFVTKMDKASILGDTIEYVKQLRKRIQDLEIRSRQSDGEGGLKTGDTTLMGWAGLGSGSDRRKIRIVEGSGGVITKVLDPPPSMVEVSIIESDALLELQCGYRQGLLLEIMQSLSELRMEITAVQSSSNNGVFTAELRAKVKEFGMGKKVTIVEVKRIIQQIITQHQL